MIAPPPIQAVIAAVQHHLPGRIVTRVEALGTWIRHNFRLTLDGGKVVYLKADADFPASEKEAWACDFLRQHDLPAPQILAVDATCSLLPSPFVIQAHVGGIKLCDALDESDLATQHDIYTALGTFYQRLHAIRYAHSGWIQGAGDVLPFSPTRHQYNEVIVKLGARAVERGYLSTVDHQRLQALWQTNLGWLDMHQPCLVGGSLPWTVYLSPEGGWHVSKMMDMHDMLYWDAAWDMTSIRYPGFREPLSEALWQTFLDGYGVEPDAKRLMLYRLMQYLDAGLGNYMQPRRPGNLRWIAWVWETYSQMLTDLA